MVPVWQQNVYWVSLGVIMLIWLGYIAVLHVTVSSVDYVEVFKGFKLKFVFDMWK